MTKEQEDFLNKHFKAGEYSTLMLMIRNEDLEKFMTILKSTNLNLAVLPGVQQKIDFANPNHKGTEQ